jgi:hypothetical protein
LLHVAERHKKARAAYEREDQQDPAKEKTTVLMLVAVDKESSEPYAACQLKAERYVQEGEKEDLSGVEKVLVVSYQVKKEKEN